MGSSYEAAIGTLGEELARIEQVLGGLTPDEWRAETPWATTASRPRTASR